MNIRYFEKERIFKIDTEHVSYVMAVIDEEQFLEHVYFGRRLQDSRNARSPQMNSVSLSHQKSSILPLWRNTASASPGNMPLRCF